MCLRIVCYFLLLPLVILFFSSWSFLHVPLVMFSFFLFVLVILCAWSPSSSASKGDAEDWWFKCQSWGLEAFSLVPFLLLFFFSFSWSSCSLLLVALVFLIICLFCSLVPCVFPLKPKLVTWQYMFQS